MMEVNHHKDIQSHSRKSMDSSIKINSISIDLADAAKEIRKAKCKHFSIRGYVAEARKRDLKKCWPFPEETVKLSLDKKSDSLIPLSVPNFRWWSCWNCTKGIGVDGTKESGHSNSTTVSEMELDGDLTVFDQEQEMETDIAGNVVEENEDVNCERTEDDDHTIAQTNAVEENEDVNCERIENDDHTIEKIAGNAVEENEDVNCERTENDDHTIDQTNAANKKKVCPRSKDVVTKVRSKSRKLARHSNSRTISEMELDGNSSKRLTVFDHEKERETDIAGNGVEENENVNCERTENGDHTIAQTNAVEENEDVNCERIEKDDHTVAQTNAVEENEDVNCERIEKDDHTIAQTNAANKKKVRPRSKDVTNVRSKSRKVASSEKVGNKKPRGKVNKPLKEKENGNQAVTTFGEIAGVIEEDTPPKATKKQRSSRRSESVNPSVSKSGPKKSGKSRLLSEMFGKGNTETSGGGGGGSDIRKEESVRGRKRKLVPQITYVRRRVLRKTGKTSENASKSCDHFDSESTDSEIERDPIKGKKRNRRFQIVDEFVPSLSQEGIPENDADPSKDALSSPVHSNGKDSVPLPLSTKITEKKKLSLPKKNLSLSKKTNKKPVTAYKKRKLRSSSAGTPRVNAISQSTQDLLDEELAAEGYFRKSTPQINDKPVVSLHLQDNDLLKSRDEEANCLRAKPNTVGGLRTEVDVVDLSNNNTNRSVSPNSTLVRHISSPTEVADLSCLLQKDASGADRNGKTVMVQEHDEEHTKENTPEEESNDEIPMDIVELMARNQYERCLPDKEEDVNNKEPSQETPHRSKNALMIDLNETYDNGISQEDNNTTRYPKLCDSNARTEEHFPIRKQQPSLEFFPISQPSVPSPFGIFPPTQENRANSIQFSGQNSQWLGRVPTMANQNPSPSSFLVLPASNTRQSVPHQHREASHLVWPPPPQQFHHHNPVSFNMYQSTKADTFSQPSNNGNGWNLNFVAPNGKQICGYNPEFSFGWKHTGGRTMERFSSESSISAFHLFNSRMDPRLNSNTHIDHHGNTTFPKRHFPPVHQAKEFIELPRGDSSKTAYPTNQSPFHFHRPETSRNSFPIIPSSFSFQNAQASWIHHQEKETKRRDTLPPVNNNSHVVGSSSNDQGKFQVLGASNSMMRPLKSHMTDNEKTQKKRAEDVKNASALPQKNTSEPIVCTVNRNPADFTIPEPGNVYMLKGEELKVRRCATYKRRQSLKQTKKPVRSATKKA